jgi:hypothetical protein
MRSGPFICHGQQSKSEGFPALVHNKQFFTGIGISRMPTDSVNSPVMIYPGDDYLPVCTTGNSMPSRKPGFSTMNLGLLF